MAVRPLQFFYPRVHCDCELSRGTLTVSAQNKSFALDQIFVNQQSPNNSSSALMNCAANCSRISALSISQTCLATSPRWFSKTSKSGKAGASSSMPQMRQPPQKSMRVLAQEAAKGGGADYLPNDLGLLEGRGFFAPQPELSENLFLNLGTFVMPSRDRRPPFVRLPRERVKLEWFRFKKRCLDLGGWVRHSVT